MGRVRARQAKEEAKEGSIAMANQAYEVGTYYTMQQAAESQGLAYSTLHGRLNGRKSRRKAHELDQTLGEAEEKKIVEQIDEMDRRGFPMRVDMACQLASKILADRERENDVEPPVLGKKWIVRFLNRHAHLATKLSTQVHKQRIVSSDP